MKDGTFLNVGAMALYLGIEVCDALLLAHALSGCDSCVIYVWHRQTNRCQSRTQALPSPHGDH